MTGDVDFDFPEFVDPPAEPYGLLRAWIDGAKESKVREPFALALATSDERGRTSSRMVVVAGVTDEGLLFTSHSTSQKGRQLAANPWASGVLYWRETSQQIIVAGPVRKLSDEEADAAWNARPVYTHAMSSACRQSTEFEDYAHVEAARAEGRRLAALDKPLPRPASYSLYRLEPEEFEFWTNGTDRLHERLRYDRSGEGWTSRRLQP
ncbi:phenazine biosynthesis FMN-dependent oxidase PhzG [Streptomyces sp. AV19]|nr:phenazine biosynthesis FMN-dependent oxidase PhzG [Streptomyces sp. AV19]MDG4534916.1 phenazine biosynthesis FMN-dependent oxidase PhzG [Streptomyces sp. AV19]